MSGAVEGGEDLEPVVPEPVEGSKGQRVGGEHEGGSAFGVHFDKLNVLRGEAGKDLELVERSEGRG